MNPQPQQRKKTVNLNIRLDPVARATLQELALGARTTQTEIVERLIMAAKENPDGYYLRAAAISAFTAAALARVVLGTVAPDHAELMAALSVVDSVARGLFGKLPPAPKGAQGFETSDARIAALLGAFGMFDPAE